MKRIAEWAYWTAVALMAAGWAAVLIDKAAPSFLGHLGPVADVVSGIGFFTFPGFTQLFVPGWLFEFILQSREAARLVYHAATAIYAALAVAAALWFGFSRRAPLRRRALVLVALMVANTLGLAASLPRAGYLVMFGLFGTGYYEWAAEKAAAENSKDPPPERPPPR